MANTAKYVPSMADLAKETGVSIATVSRVLKGDARISGATKEKVQDAASRLGYTQNLMVNGIRGSGNRTVGVSMPVDDYYSRVFNGISAALWERGCVPLTVPPNLGGVKEREILTAFVERRVEGVIARPIVYAEIVDRLKILKERGLPMVLVDCDIEGAGIPFSGTDDYEGGRQAAERLVALGHKVVGHLTGYMLSSSAKGRCEGFAARLSSFPGTVERRFVSTGFSAKEPQVEEMLLSEPRPTAVFAANDSMAAVVCAVARRLGLRLPEELSVIGFGDLPFSRLSSPKLNSFDQSPEKVGAIAVEMLFEEISGVRVPGAGRRVSLLKPLYVERESVACARA